jgi:glycine dehydrogenase subunit 1
VSYVGRSVDERARMFATIGVKQFEDLLVDVPNELRLHEALDVPPAASELELRAEVGAMAAKNDAARDLPSFLGAGMYDHYIPSALPRVALRSEFMTAYTPYQPEVAQGTLQVIFEFQSMIAELTGLDVANASQYDAASACAEAAALARSQTGRAAVVVTGGVHPHLVQALATHVGEANVRSVAHDPATGTTSAQTLEAALAAGDAACVFVGYPNVFGAVEELGPLCAASRAKGALAVVVADPIALALLTPPGALGADLCVGEAQSLGAPMSFGGPVCGFFAGRKEYVRRFPGRIVGQTVDGHGRRGFVLTLQTREQHIRREKATSNICTNQGLIALMNTIYLALLGKQGLVDVATLCFQKTHYAARRALEVAGVSPAFSSPFVREVALRLPAKAADVVRHGRELGFLLGVDGARLDPAWADVLLVAATEKRTKTEIDGWADALKAAIARARGAAR